MLSAAISNKYGISLKVTDVNRFEGGAAIYFGTDSFDSYNEFRYCIAIDPDAVAIHLMGEGQTLEAAAEALVEKWLDTPDGRFPFAMQDRHFGYCWQSNDPGATSKEMTLEAKTAQTLTQGVYLHELRYTVPGIGAMSFFATALHHDSPATMMAVAAPWDSSNNPDAPAQLYTVSEYAQQLQDAGHHVLAVTNGGFFRRSEGSNVPFGTQILDGNVIQAPSYIDLRYSDSWLGVTQDGKYIISDAYGYAAWEGKLRYALGGGKLLMRDRELCFSSAEMTARTCAGITSGGDLVLLSVESANYAMMVQAFMDLDMDIVTILNLDGGGSTTMLAADSSGELQTVVCGNGKKQRPVADAWAIVLP